jgi:hypothetical protein
MSDEYSHKIALSDFYCLCKNQEAAYWRLVCVRQFFNHVAGSPSVSMKNYRISSYKNIIHLIVIQCMNKIPEIVIEYISHSFSDSFSWLKKEFCQTLAGQKAGNHIPVILRTRPRITVRNKKRSCQIDWLCQPLRTFAS